MNKDIILCGVGGQGTVLASKLIAAAAMKRDLPVMSAETIGMAQRGGSVFGHVRIGGNLYSPMIAEGYADLIIGFEPGEAVRMLPFLKPDGQVIVSRRAILPVTASLSGSSYNGDEMIAYLKKHIQNLLVVNPEKACKEIGSPKILNTLLLGAAVSGGTLGFSEEEIIAVMKERLPKRFHELNIKALGYYNKRKDT